MPDRMSGCFHPRRCLRNQRSTGPKTRAYDFLKESLTSISYVAAEPVRAVPVAGCLNERHITGIATKRNNSPRMPRPSSVLDGGGSRVETFGLPKLLQYGSRSRVAGESGSDSDCGIQTRR